MKESNMTFQELAALNLKDYQSAVSFVDKESRVSFPDTLYNDHFLVTLILLETCVVYVSFDKDKPLLLRRLREVNRDWLTDIIRVYPEIRPKLLLCLEKLEESERLRKML